MIHVQLNSPHLGPWIYRQTPLNDGVWEGVQFDVARDDRHADWLVVLDRPTSDLETTLPKDRRILLISEPPEVQRFDIGYLKQFGLVVSFYEVGCAAGKEAGRADLPSVIMPACLPWFYGLSLGGNTGHDDRIRSQFTWSSLATPNVPPPERDIELSVICSKKAVTKQQVRRLRFLALLKEALGPRLEIYGRGFEPLSDKSEVICRSRYHLALENSQTGLYWSEKLADPILGGAFPFHAGSKQSTELFDPNGICNLDLTQPHLAVRQVVALLDRDPVKAAATEMAMRENRRRLMEEFNLFAQMSNLIRSTQIQSTEGSRLDQPVSIIRPRKRWSDRLRSHMKGVQRLIWLLDITLFERK